jgi:hypothetical protein
MADISRRTIGRIEGGALRSDDDPPGPPAGGPALVDGRQHGHVQMIDVELLAAAAAPAPGANERRRG